MGGIIVIVIKDGDYLGMGAFTRKKRVKIQSGGNCLSCYVVVGLLGLVYYFDKSDALRLKK